MRAAFAATGLWLLASAPVAAADDFDFYVLSLSWSPTHCATDDDPDEAQCGVKRGFVVHGLWPQYERGYPEFCSSRHPRWLDQDVIDAHRDIFPSGGLAIHQWRKHGMCSGLAQWDYFDLTRDAATKVNIPAIFSPGDADRGAKPVTVEDLFVKANEGLSYGAMSVQCKRGQLTEVRICLTHDLEFRDCDEVDDDTCRLDRIMVPSIR